MKKKNLKALVLSMGLVLGMVTPVIAQAQWGGGVLGYGRDAEQISRGGLFGNPDEIGGYFLYNQQFGDENGGYNLSNQTFGQEVPLGSGLLILMTAAAGYVLKKRKNNDNNLKS